jgi:hypothetical protein
MRSLFYYALSGRTLCLSSVYFFFDYFPMSPLGILPCSPIITLGLL